jgi:hypothetical protein
LLSSERSNENAFNQAACTGFPAELQPMVAERRGRRHQTIAAFNQGRNE